MMISNLETVMVGEWSFRRGFQHSVRIAFHREGDEMTGVGMLEMASRRSSVTGVVSLDGIEGEIAGVTRRWTVKAKGEVADVVVKNTLTRGRLVSIASGGMSLTARLPLWGLFRRAASYEFNGQRWDFNVGLFASGVARNPIFPDVPIQFYDGCSETTLILSLLTTHFLQPVFNDD